MTTETPCITGAAYTVTIDWDGNGIVTGTGEAVTNDVLGDGAWSFTYGRDQARQLRPPRIGAGRFNLCNVDRVYSPENTSSPIADEMGVAADVAFDVTHNGTDYPLFRAFVDDFNVHPDFTNRTVNFTIIDRLARLQNTRLSTAVYTALRTGQIINIILDEVGWPASERDIDVGGTFTRFWWAEDTDAFTALREIIAAEGPPSIAYADGSGVFVFKDRHHRLLDANSVTSQAAFNAPAFACDAPPVTGFSYTPPFDYSHGWRDIINSVNANTDELQASISPEVVWSADTPISLTSGQTISITASTNTPVIDAITPVEGVDLTSTGAGTVTAVLLRDSGRSITINLTAASGDATVTSLQLRGRPVASLRTVTISQSDSGSISRNGERSYPDPIPWATPNDVFAVASQIVGNYAVRRPTVRMRIVAQDDAHLLQILQRTISDRITIGNGELGLSDVFFIEQVTHVIRRANTGLLPVHEALLGCERRPSLSVANPFTFDVAGRGFDQGQFTGIGLDNPDTVFIFDHPTQGQFDTGTFAT